MLSGIWPRGSNSAPGSGNTGITWGRSPGPRYSALIGIAGPDAVKSLEQLFSAHSLHKAGADLSRNALREQDRRQPFAPLNGGLIGRAPRLEELHQLLARAVVVPFAVALDDFEQLTSGLAALAAGVERGCKIESGLMIERVCGDFLFQLGHRADRLGLLGEIDRHLHRLDRRVITF